MRVGWKRIISFLFFIAIGHAHAQVKFTAVATPAQLGPNDYTELKFIIENASDLDHIQPPAINNFTLISGPSQENGMSVINGDVKKYVAVSYVIKPKGIGNFTIAGATAKIDGREMRSNSVTIKVDNAFANANNNSGLNAFNTPFNFPDPFADASPEPRFNDNILKKGDNAIEKIKNNLFVRLETDKTSCYVGEPIIASYKLYTRLQSESNITKNPSFSGFSVIDLQQPDNVTSRVEKLNGREYNVYTIRKVQLYPLQAGNLELESAEVENNVHFIKAEYMNRRQDAFGDMFPGFQNNNIPPEGIEDHKLTLQSKPITILVKPLPAGSPATFKGAVGNFEINAAVAKNAFTTDDAGALTVTISGAGNLQMVTAPDISWPNGIEGFDAKTSDDLYKTNVPVSGRKIMEYPFTVSTAGEYTIPPISYSFFDPKTATYKTVSTKPVKFTVTPGTGKPKTFDTSTITKNEPSMLMRFFSNRLRVVSVVAALILIGLIFWLKRDKRKEESAIQQLKDMAELESVNTIIENQKNPLADAEESMLISDGSTFYQKLNSGFKNYLSNKLQIPLEDLNKKSINEKMDKASIPLGTSLEINKLMDEIEWQLFTPDVDNEKMQDMYSRANVLMQEINSRLLSSV